MSGYYPVSEVTPIYLTWIILIYHSLQLPELFVNYYHTTEPAYNKTPVLNATVKALTKDEFFCPLNIN